MLVKVIDFLSLIMKINEILINIKHFTMQQKYIFCYRDIIFEYNLLQNCSYNKRLKKITKVWQSSNKTISNLKTFHILFTLQGMVRLFKQYLEIGEKQLFFKRLVYFQGSNNLFIFIGQKHKCNFNNVTLAIIICFIIQNSKLKEITFYRNSIFKSNSKIYTYIKV